MTAQTRPLDDLLRPLRDESSPKFLKWREMRRRAADAGYPVARGWLESLYNGNRAQSKVPLTEYQTHAIAAILGQPFPEVWRVVMAQFYPDISHDLTELGRPERTTGGGRDTIEDMTAEEWTQVRSWLAIKRSQH